MSVTLRRGSPWSLLHGGQYIDWSDGSVMRKVIVYMGVSLARGAGVGDGVPVPTREMWTLNRPDGSQIGPLHDTLVDACTWDAANPGRPR